MALPIGVDRARVPWLAVFLIAGTVVRVAYAVLFKPWWQAADHLAWDIVLKSVGHFGGLGYWQLIHYPQEGGSIPVSLLTLLIGRIPGVAALPASALVVDALSRWIQLKVVSERFDRRVLLLFGAWTVAGLPILVTWSSVNCGLHSVASFFPFLMLWLVTAPHAGPARGWRDGALCGLFIWFTYDCVLLLPLYAIALFRQPGAFGRAARFIAALLAVLGMHLAVRSLFDAGFHLPEWGPASVRGLDFQRPLGMMVRDIGTVWVRAVPGSSLLPGLFGIEVRLVRWFWALFVLAGALGCWWVGRTDPAQRRNLYTCLVAVVAFAVGYAISPLAVHQVDHPSYMYYRHWAFILPMIALTTIAGLAGSRPGRSAVWCFVALSSSGVMAMFRDPPSRDMKLLDTGFVLALKLGHDPARLETVIGNVPELAHDLWIGAGWGTAEELLVFNDPTPEDAEYLVSLVNTYSPPERALMIQGVELAFSCHGTDRIPEATRAKVLEGVRPVGPESR